MTVKFRRYKWLNFQRKTLIIYIAIIIIPFAIAFTFFTFETNKEAQTSNINYMNQLNDQISNNINIIMSDINRSSFINIMSKGVEDILQKAYKQTGWEYVMDVDYLNNAARFSSRMNPFILGFTFIGKNGNIYSTARTTKDNQEQVLSFLPKVDEKRGKSYITPVYKAKILSDNEIECISLARMLLHSSSFKGIGFVWIDIDFKRFADEFDKLAKGNNLSYLLIIQGDSIIYRSPYIGNLFGSENEQNIISEINKSWNPTGLNIQKLKVAGKEITFVGKENTTTMWKLIQCSPIDTGWKSTAINIKLFFLTLLIVLAATILTGYFLSVKMSRPINKLHQAMKQIEEHGQLGTIEGEGDRKDEIGMLINSFNRMSVRLQESINKEYVAQLNSRKIEIKMLQAQINPHFLYNTLNLIGSIGRINGMREIYDAAISLSDLFRYNIKGKNIATVRDEIQQINNYIRIQQLRFPDKISIEYYVQDRLFNFKILKFLLQPLVENAIYHGIERKKSKGHIKIFIEEKDEVFDIKIEDDGVGMDEEKLKELNANLDVRDEIQMADDDYGSLGIKNVHYRIQSYYGRQFGLKVFSNEYGGISVKMVIPVIKGDI